MFSYNELSGRSNLEKVSMSELFSDIKLTADGMKLKEQGYIPIKAENISLKLYYWAKPTQAVIDYMVKSGRGMPASAEIGITLTVAFSANWDGYQTQPRIAGVVEQSDLDAFKESAELVGDCIVSKAYDAFRKVHPNFAIHYVREPSGSELREVQRLASLVWIAVGYSTRNKEMIAHAKSGQYNQFYFDQSLLNHLNEKFGIKVPEVAEKKRISLELAA